MKDITYNFTGMWSWHIYEPVHHSKQPRNSVITSKENL
jgi:hypothetical protein